VSVEAITWAWKQPVKSQAERLVLLALSDSANGDTFECWPSHKFIAQKAMCSVATVKRAVKSLQQYGFLTIQPRFYENERQSNLYTVLVSNGQPDTASDTPPVHSDPPVHNGDPTPVHNSDLQNRHITVHKWIKAWGKSPTGVDPQAWAEWVDYKRGSPRKGTVTKTGNFLRKYGRDDQRQIVDQSIQNGWKGLFPPKGVGNGKRPGGRRQTFDEIRAEQQRVIDACEGREPAGDSEGDPRVVAAY